MEGADFLCLRLAGGDPNGLNKSVEELIETVKEVADAVDVPLVVEGCKNVEKDSELLTKSSRGTAGKKRSCYVRKRRRLQGSWCSRRSGIQPESRR